MRRPLRATRAMPASPSWRHSSSRSRASVVPSPPFPLLDRPPVAMEMIARYAFRSKPRWLDHRRGRKRGAPWRREGVINGDPGTRATRARLAVRSPDHGALRLAGAKMGHGRPLDALRDRPDDVSQLAGAMRDDLSGCAQPAPERAARGEIRREK